MKYTITGKGYSSNFDGEEKFKKTARAILRDNGLNDSDFFELKTDSDYINALKEKGYEVKTGVHINAETINKVGEILSEVADNVSLVAAQITKIKIDKKSRLATIHYCRNSSKSEKEVIFRGFEEATDKFIKDFRQMSEWIISALDFPEEWLPLITTTGLSITWKEGQIMGMVITAQKEILGLAAPFNLNTPFIQVESYHFANDTCDDVFFCHDCEVLLNEIIADAKRYMNGDVLNKQQKLELG